MCCSGAGAITMARELLSPGGSCISHSHMHGRKRQMHTSSSFLPRRALSASYQGGKSLAQLWAPSRCSH
jgi:hypothetical protein